jgi:UDP-glucose:(heptosyl)LPS alpha-1,3-glucosyltransferase
MSNVAVVIPKYGLIGGAEQFVAELTGRLAGSTDFNIHIYANRWEKTAAPLTFHRVPIISFPKFLTTPSFAHFTREKIKKNDISLIHSHERIFGADIFTLHGIPHRYWVQHIRRKRMSLYDLATAHVEKTLVYNGNCKKFIAVSSLTRNIFLQEYAIDPGLVEIIHPGVDLNDYNRLDKNEAYQSVRKELGINNSQPLLLFASMNFEIKGLDYILQALAKVKIQGHSSKLVVAGKGNIKKYRKLSLDLGIADDVVFTGPVAKEKMIRMYLAGDFYIMLSQFDTFGMVVLEAMAAGLPVIISSNVGAKDLVQENKSGFIIDNTSDTDYIAAKIALLLDENIRRKMSSYALQTAAQNTWNDVTKKYATIYKSILKEKLI